MAAANTDLLMEVGDPGTATTLSAPGYTAGGTSINVGSTSNWPTATGVVFAIDEAEIVDGEEVRVDGTYNEFVGTVATGTSITNVDWVRGVGDRDYAAGALTRVYIVVSAERENRIVEWGTAEHNQDGTHKALSAPSAAITGAVTVGTTLGVTGTTTLNGAVHNGRVVHAVQAMSSSSTLTPNADSYNIAECTALATNTTLANPSGTPVNGQVLVVRIKDNGSARTIAYGSSYQNVSGLTSLTTTTAGKWHILGCIYSSSVSKWQIVSITTEA